MQNWFKHPIKIGKQACETLNQVQSDMEAVVVDIKQSPPASESLLARAKYQ